MGVDTDWLILSSPSLLEWISGVMSSTMPVSLMVTSLVVVLLPRLFDDWVRVE